MIIERLVELLATQPAAFWLFTFLCGLGLSNLAFRWRDTTDAEGASLFFNFVIGVSLLCMFISLALFVIHGLESIFG